MRVHPAPKRRSISSDASTVSRQKKLRRLPHIFSKVLELPFPSDADVAVEEGPTELRFVAATDDLDAADVRAHAIEIYAGVTKVVIRDGDGDAVDEEEEGELNRWRFRLPEETRPRLATAEYVDGELIVRVPKGMDDDNDDEEDERRDFGIGQLVVVQ